MEYRMIARDGHLVWVHDQIVLMNELEGEGQLWQGIMLDITERKQADEQVVSARAFLQGVQRCPLRAYCHFRRTGQYRSGQCSLA